MTSKKIKCNITDIDDALSVSKVFLLVEPFSFELLEIPLYRSFFDNVCFYLENKIWGSRFPIVMQNLYNGAVEVSNLKDLLKEIDIIQQEFSKIEVNDLIWDIENLEERCPYLDNMVDEIKTLADFWKTSYKSEDMFEILKRIINFAIENQTEILVEFE